MVARNLLRYVRMIKEKSISLIENQPEQKKIAAFELYRESCGAKLADIAALRKVFGSVPEGLNAVETAKEMRKALIAGGYHYDDHAFHLQDIRRRKGGNCLGLSLLIGAELIERGFSPEFRLITRPKDAIARKEQELFDRLMTGGLLDYDRPKLPEHQADHPIYRFGPLAHPVLILDGSPFETTGLEDVEENPEWSPEAESNETLRYAELTATIFSEQAKQMDRTTEEGCRASIALTHTSLERWPKNTDALFTLWANHSALGETDPANKAGEKYLNLPTTSSGIAWAKYCITKDEAHLNDALARYPSFLFPFVEKYVTLEKDTREARFNLAVAAWCAGNSNVISLRAFYREYTEELERLFGKTTAESLLE